MGNVGWYHQRNWLGRLVGEPAVPHEESLLMSGTKGTTMIRLAVCSCMVGLLVNGPVTEATAGLVLDNFEEGAFTVTDTPDLGPKSDIQEPLDPANSIAGRRVVWVAVSSGDSATFFLELHDGADDAATFQIGMHTTFSGKVGLYYDTGTVYDLSTAGDVVQVDLVAAPAVGTLSMSLEDANDGKAGLDVAIDGAGLYTMPLADFAGIESIDLTRIWQTEMVIEGTSGSAPLTYAVSHISVNAAVPEPPSQVLLATCAMGLAAWACLRRRCPGATPG